MEQIYLKQKVFSITESFTFFDGDENIIFTASGSFLEIPKSYTLFDAGQRAVLEVTRTFFSFMPEFTIIDLTENVEICKIRKRFRLGSPKLDIFTPKGQYLIDGSFLAHEFDVSDEQGRLIFSVHKQWISWGDTYEISVDTNLIYKHVAAGIVLAIDCAYHRK